VASGKSAVAAQFARLGAHVIDGDKLGHQVLELPVVVQAAVDHWGPEAVGGNGQLDRRFVAQRVFKPSEKGKSDLEFWEGVTHPQITTILEQLLSELPKQTIVVLDAAVMFKAGWDRRCQFIVFVDVPEQQRMGRAVEQRGWTKQHFRQREAAQLSLAEKRAKCTTVIDNSGTLEETYVQVLAFWKSLSDDNSKDGTDTRLGDSR
jgi:dephospho-CoA kinase